MKSIFIHYENISQSDAIEKKIHETFQKLQKFLHPNYSIDVKLLDDTPHRKSTKNMTYLIKIKIKNIEHGKNRDYTLNEKHNDIYTAIDTAVNRLEEILRRKHDKNTNHFNNLKQILLNKMQSVKDFKFKRHS